MQSLDCTVEVRASVSDALSAWSEFAPAADGAHRVDFEALAAARSRVTLAVAAPDPTERALPLSLARVRRELARRLSAFEAFVERRSPARPGERGHG